MLNNQIVEDLNFLRLYGAAQAYIDQKNNPAIQSLSADDQIQFLITAEKNDKENRKIKRLIQQANFKEQACSARVRS